MGILDWDMGWGAKADLIGQNIYYGFNNTVRTYAVEVLDNE